jgi:DNA-directed RNA polymerase specialized sigma24 family protein
MRKVIASLRTLFRDIAAAQPPMRSTALRSIAVTARLPQDTRRVVTLRKVYDFTVPEIATRLGLTPRAVERHLITAALVFSGCIDLSESHCGESDLSAPTPSVSE